MEYFASVGLELLINSPLLVAWLVGIILSARMLRRYGGRAERLLLLGCCLMFGEKLFSPLRGVLLQWYVAEYGPELEQLALVNSYIAVPLTLVTMGGIVCLIFAFWFRWRGDRPTVQ